MMPSNNGSSSVTTFLGCSRFYFITDRINNNDLYVEYCPTEEMVGDFFTKPLQGKLFYKFRASIMDLKE